jgi:NADH-quinone oxidoreductase subunit A
LFILPKLLNFKEYPYFQEKKSSYECGFEPFSSAHKTFDVHFIVVALLFLLFDFELLLLFPYAIDYNCGMENFGPAALINLFLFLFILLVGFVYKCLAGAMLDGLVSP